MDFQPIAILSLQKKAGNAVLTPPISFHQIASVPSLMAEASNVAGGSSEGLDKLKEVKTASVAMGQPVGLEKKRHPSQVSGQKVSADYLFSIPKLDLRPQFSFRDW